MTKINFKDFPILLSARVRLTEDQRTALREAYRKAREASSIPVATTPTGLTVATASTAVELDRRLGLSSMVFADLIASRDSIAIGIVLRIQLVLGVEVVSQKDVKEAFNGYLKYIFDKATSETPS